MGCWSGPAEMVGDKRAKGAGSNNMELHKIQSSEENRRLTRPGAIEEHIRNNGSHLNSFLNYGLHRARQDWATGAPIPPMSRIVLTIIHAKMPLVG